MMYPYGGGGGFGWGAAMAMSIFGLLVLIGIVLLIIWAVRAGEHQHRGAYYGSHAGRPEQPGTQWRPAQPGMMQPGPGGYQQQATRDPAVDAVRERYARGEISKDEYDEIMRNLGYPSPPPPPAPPAAT